MTVRLHIGAQYCGAEVVPNLLRDEDDVGMGFDETSRLMYVCFLDDDDVLLFGGEGWTTNPSSSVERDVGVNAILQFAWQAV